ncbi:hypothetical protein HF086_002662 [Spodoptera exigua]|uniref:SUZ domain-containing protein n=1 Tax=Spodoptera exigua TaxID=7107 RepID=A0A922SGY9_SPOEX|nr:hypothetical protein HF086_002662 [Spodoptera exigua]
MEEPGVTLASYRSKSLEQREKEYERVRRRIFSSLDSNNEKRRGRLEKQHSFIDNAIPGASPVAGPPWSGGGVAPVPPKLVVPELYPLHCVQYPHSYPHYNIVYPQVIQQPYPVCQPMYPVIEKQTEQRNSNRNSKHNSISNSACQTPFQEDKLAEEEKKSRQNSEITAKIQQIKTQMAQLNTKDGKEKEYRKRDDFRQRRNNGNGLLGNCPVNNYNGRVFG